MALADLGEVGRHYGAGRPLGIGLQPQDVAAVHRRDQRQQFLHDLRVDLVEDVHPVVAGQIGNELPHRLAVGRFDDLDLFVAIEIAEDFGPGLRIGLGQHGPGFGRAQSLHEFRRPRGVQRGAEFAQLGRVVLGQHLAQFGQVEGVDHGRAAVKCRIGEYRSPAQGCQSQTHGAQEPRALGRCRAFKI